MVPFQIITEWIFKKGLFPLEWWEENSLIIKKTLPDWTWAIRDLYLLQKTGMINFDETVEDIRR